MIDGGLRGPSVWAGQHGNHVRGRPVGQPRAEMGVRGRKGPQARQHDRGCAGGDGRAHDRHPGVVAVRQPVVVRDPGESVKAPVLAPRVLHDEAARVVADEGEGVATDRGRPGLPRDRRDRGLRVRDGIPTPVHVGRHVHGADLVDGRLEIGDRILHDPVVGAERPLRGIGGPLGVGRDELGVAVLVAVRPELVGAHAVVEPALHGAAAARSLVVLAGPLVVLAGEVVDHARAHRRRRGRLGEDGLPEEQVVDDGGQPESGAGSLLALVEDQPGLRVLRQVGLDPLRWRVLMGQRDERRLVDAIAEVRPIRTGIEGDRSLRCPEDLRRHGCLPFPLGHSRSAIPALMVETTRRDAP